MQRTDLIRRLSSKPRAIRRRAATFDLERLEERTLLSTGLVAAYSFDGGSGTTIYDSSGNGNNGTISNATWSTAGKFGDALSFNGTNAVVTIPNSASLDLTTAMTLEAWVNPSAVNYAWTDVIYKGSGSQTTSSDNYYLEPTSTDSGSAPVGGAETGSPSVETDAPGTAALPVNTWTYLAATYNGSTMSLYVNGTSCRPPRDRETS